jgi:N utilization substance protein B
MSTARTDARQAGRELALAVMCHLESYPVDEHARAVALLLDGGVPSGDADGEDVIARFASDPATRAFADELVALCNGRRAEIDALVEETSRSWRLSRMDRVDRNVVRMATGELLGRAEVPRAAILSEAVRLAGRYGSERSAAFVNGLVEALAKRVRPDAGAGDAS